MPGAGAVLLPCTHAGGIRKIQRLSRCVLCCRGARTAWRSFQAPGPVSRPNHSSPTEPAYPPGPHRHGCRRGSLPYPCASCRLHRRRISQQRLTLQLLLQRQTVMMRPCMTEGLWNFQGRPPRCCTALHGSLLNGCLGRPGWLVRTRLPCTGFLSQVPGSRRETAVLAPLSCR